MAKIIVTQNLVRELLNYDPETGIFTWRHRDRKYFQSDRSQKIWNVRFAGKKAGSITYYGYIQIPIFKCGFFAHRLAILYITGSFPSMHVDHIDRNKSNNAFKNLREVNNSVNMQNVFNHQSNNKLKIRGVCKGYGNKFVAHIKANGKQCYLGTFSTADEAQDAYLAAKQVYHPGAVFALDTA